MKRNDMILNMASEIVMFDHSITFDKAQDMAGAILDRQEKEGILPPSYNKPNEVFFDVTTFNKVNEWEKE